MIAQCGVRLRDDASGQFQHIARACDEGAKPHRGHCWNKVNDASRVIQKQDINRERHSKRVNCFFAAQQQSFAGAERRVSQQAAQARPPTRGNRTVGDKWRVARAIVRA